jgi:hypothetical protein
VQPNVYGHDVDAWSEVREIAVQRNLLDKLDWKKVHDIIQQAQGVAQEVTLIRGSDEIEKISAPPRDVQKV